MLHLEGYRADLINLSNNLLKSNPVHRSPTPHRKTLEVFSSLAVTFYIIISVSDAHDPSFNRTCLHERRVVHPFTY